MKLRLGLTAGLAFVLALPLTAQQTLRDSALALADARKGREARPLFEQLVARDSSDRVLLERLGFILLETSGALPDASARKAQRAQVRQLFAKAVALGSTNQQVVAIAELIPADGGNDATFSGNKDVNASMTQAEAAYSAGDYRKALALYQRALALDPALYDAALFSGDTYLHLQSIDSAYLWYAHATEINPDRETAWRYWSDVLLRHDRSNEARDKAVEAAVAEPFNRLSRTAIIAWGQRTRTPLGFPRVSLPVHDTAAIHSPAWLAYDSVRRVWQGAGGRRSSAFVVAYPSDTGYRHSVKEEKAALQAAWRAATSDSATSNLKQLDEAGLLEAWIFYLRADAGIAVEYPAYLRTHRDELRRFWTAFVIGAPYAR